MKALDRENVHKLFRWMMNANDKQLRTAFAAAACIENANLPKAYFYDRFIADVKFRKCQEVSIMVTFMSMADARQQLFIDSIIQMESENDVEPLED